MTKETARALLEDCLSLERDLALTVEKVMGLVPKSEQKPHRDHMRSAAAHLREAMDLVVAEHPDLAILVERRP
jgi:hypothetical protein